MGATRRLNMGNSGRGFGSGLGLVVGLMGMVALL